MAELPRGTVTFLFTDIEGSTRLLHEHGDEYASVLAEHRRALREAFASHDGVEVDTQGDAFFVAFGKATDALAAAAEARHALSAGPIRVRMGVHTGEPTVTDEGYVGIDVHRAARIASAGHGGQILVSQTTRDLAHEGDLLDLGEHRLKDLADAERIYQLGAGDFPPLKTISNSNLPLPAEPLIGRKKELADVLRLLRDSARLVTVTGPGGIGKTRFALQPAAELVGDFRDGVWWVSLAPLRDPGLVLPTIGAVTGAGEDVWSALREKQMLLLLDNFEHVVDAAPQLAELQQSCPQMRLLVTSREPLHVAGEREYPLSPLPESPAVELFRQRAEAVSPGFDAEYGSLVDVCDRLDRLPLAIELAAARTKALPVKDLLGKLEQRLPLLTSRRRDVDERQRTLRATIEWSYELLDDPDKQAFAALGVFAGSFDAHAAASVCDVDVDALESLVDKSLLRARDDGRFFMLETIREYATALLDDSALAREVRDRHLEHYLHVVVTGEPALVGDRPDEALAALVLDENNIRAAFAYACDKGDAERALMLVGSNWRFWSFRAQPREGVQMYERALSLAGETSERARARAVYGLGEMELAAGHHDRARILLEQAIPLLRAADDLRWVASATNHLANSHLAAGDSETARRLYEEALQLARNAGHERVAAVVIGNIGFLALEEGRDAEAEARLNESLEVHQRLSNRAGVADASLNLALLSLRREDIAATCAHLARSLDLYESLGTFSGALEALLITAVVVAHRGDLRTSVQLQSAGRALANARGYAPSPLELAIADEALERARTGLDDHAFADESARGALLGQNGALLLARQSIH
jgi:predicted ATPase